MTHCSITLVRPPSRVGGIGDAGTRYGDGADRIAAAARGRRRPSARPSEGDNQRTRAVPDLWDALWTLPRQVFREAAGAR